MTSYDLSSQSGNHKKRVQVDQDVLALAFRKRRYSTAGTLGSIEECIKEGYLLKQHGSFQRWKTRYFRLYPKQLFYAKSPTSAIFHEVDVSDISLAETSVNNVNNSFKVIASHCSLVLCAENRKDMEAWISAFKVAACSIAKTHSELTDRLSGEHHWYSSTHSRPTFCNVCGEQLAGISGKGLSCEVCRFKAHKQCASKAPRNCKWTTLDSIPSDLRLPGNNDDPFAMPHQWFEGNLPPNSRCFVCDNTCGSKRRIQDWTCLWCDAVIHTGCKSKFPKKCSLGPNNLSIIPPTALRRAEYIGPGVWEALSPTRGSPLLVFVNSKSGDNQGIRFMRTFKQLLNPAQIFDLSVAGPTLGLSMSKNFEHFRILVCGGDGSVGWVLTEVDKQQLSNKCQISVLPLGTGNDLARVLGWGSTCYDVAVVPLVLKQLERARPEMLDRWSICVKRFPSDLHQADGSITGYEDSIAMHLTRMLSSNHYDVVLQSARFVFETVKDFVAQVGAASARTNPEEASDPESLSEKCKKLQNKMSLLLRTLQIESEAGKKIQSCLQRTNSMENLQEETSQYERKLSESFKSHSDSDVRNEEPIIEIVPKRKRKPKVAIPKEHLWSRANSLKKAVREIINHTEKAVDEQNAQTSKQVEEAVAQLSLDRSSDSVSSYSRSRASSSITDIEEKDIGNEKVLIEDRPGLCVGSPMHCGLGTIDESMSKVERRKSASQGSIGLHTESILKNSSQLLPSPERMRKKSCPTSSSYKRPNPSYRLLKPATVIREHNERSTVIFPGTVIAKSFVKEQTSHRFISRVLLANANALAAAAMPEIEKQEDLSTFQEKCVMNNYFGIGIDAKISLDFHNRREEHPEKCRSRKKNMIWYGVLGGKEIVNSTYKNLDKNVHLECDGHAINLPSLQGIVVLNIPSYMGGANFWGTKKEVNGFYSPSFDDRMLEVVAVLRASQMGMSKVFGGMQHCRIAQCHTVKITITDESVPVQVDGEAWLQEPGIVHIVHKNRMPMLIRDREFEETLRSWNELKQGKVDRINEPLTSEEEELLNPLSSSILSLVRGIKAVSMICSEVQQELYQSAIVMNSTIEQIEKTKSESLTRGRVCDFVNHAKAFISEVNEQLWTLKPELSKEMENKIVSALSQADSELSKFVEQQSLLSVKVEEEQKMQRATHSTVKEKFNLFSKQSKEKPDLLFNKKVVDWGISEVSIWLDSVGCGEYKGIFNQHDIRGPELIALEKTDLHDLGITKIGHVKRLLEKIKQLEKSTKSTKTSKWSRKPKS